MKCIVVDNSHAFIHVARSSQAHSAPLVVRLPEVVVCRSQTLGVLTKPLTLTPRPAESSCAELCFAIASPTSAGYN